MCSYLRDPSSNGSISCNNLTARRLNVRLLHRIEALEFDTCISGAELPVHRANPLVALLLPALNLPTQLLDGGNVVGQALPCEHREFNLGDVEPTGVLGGVMDLQPVC
jgi:hypothetical protein